MKENKNKKIIIVVSILVMLLLVGGFYIYKSLSKEKTSGTEKQGTTEKSNLTPLLYEVTKEGSSNKMYLFGSIHAANKTDLDSLPDYVLSAYNNSHYIACELDDASANDPAVMANLMLSMMYSDGTTIKDHLSETTYNKMVELLKKKKSYSALLENYKPAYFATLIEQLSSSDAGLDITSSVDSYMLAKARNDKKTIIEVESLDFQMDLLYGFSDVLYNIMISEMVDNYEETVKNVKVLYDSWKRGDVEGILTTSEEDVEIKEEYTEEEKKAIQDYEDKLFNDRNKGMVDKAVEYFENNQDVFFMVGAAHIVGDNGVANVLKTKGYTVTQVK